MSMFKDMTPNFFQDALGFGERDDRRGRSVRRRYAAARARGRDDADAISRWEGEGGRYKRRKEGFDFIDD
jgi:hypothetical protein